MMINVANIAALNEGEIHIVSKKSIEEKHQRTRAFYCSSRENATKIILSEITYDMGDLVELTYIRYDAQGHVLENLPIYQKNERCEE